MNVRWALGRLRSMPIGELPHRVRERWRLLVPSRPAPAPVEEPIPRWPVPQGPAPIDLERLRRDALGLCRGGLVLLGHEWPHRTAWDVDPVTRTRWTRWARNDRRDIKLCWEHHRLPHLQVLAAAGRLCSLPEATDCARDDLQSWLAAVEPGRGVAYASATECADRVFSLLLSVGWLDGVPAGSEGRLWDHLAWHAHTIERFPSRFSSANNHRVSELSALLFLGLLAPALPGADRWRGLGPELLAVARTLIGRDGWGVEQSPSYTAYVVERLLLAETLCARFGVPFPAEDLVVPAATALRSLMDEGGQHPRIGDDDDSVAVRTRMDRDDLVGSVCAAVGARYGVPTTPPRWTADLRGWLMGVSSVPPVAVVTGATYEDLTVLKQKIAGRSAMLVFDHGPLGFQRIAGHGHADQLAIWLHLDDRPVLVDAGTYVYNGNPAWRRFLRSLAAHNTVCVDGLDPVPQAGPFNWGQRVDVRHEAREGALVAWYEANGIRHARTVRANTDGFTLEDRLDGRGEHAVQSHLLVAPGWEVEERRGTAVLRLDGAPWLTIEGSGLPLSVVSGGTEPGPGAVSLRYGEILPAHSLLLEGRIRLPCTLRWVLRVQGAERQNASV